MYVQCNAILTSNCKILQNILNNQYFKHSNWCLLEFIILLHVLQVCNDSSASEGIAV